jgi:hypothetical protein
MSQAYNGVQPGMSLDCRGRCKPRNKARKKGEIMMQLEKLRVARVVG